MDAHGNGSCSPRLDRPSFAVGGAAYTWCDVVHAGRAWSDWTPIESRTREGLACRRRLDEEPGALARADVEQAAREFRYARRLLSAEEARAWLARWKLSVEDWQEFLRRSLLRRRWAEELPLLASRYPAARAEIEAFAEVEAICSGELERLAGKLAGRAAAHAAVTDAANAERAEPSRLEESFGRFRALHVTAETVRRALEAHRLDWVRLELEEIVLAEEPTAREAVLSIRDDGRPVADVARDAGAPVRRTAFLLDEAESALAAALLAAAEGDVVGPLELHGGSWVARVLTRLSPSLDDPAILRRAEETALHQAVRREVINRVRWFDRD